MRLANKTKGFKLKNFFETIIKRMSLFVGSRRIILLPVKQTHIQRPENAIFYISLCNIVVRLIFSPVQTDETQVHDG